LLVDDENVGPTLEETLVEAGGYGEQLLQEMILQLTNILVDCLDRLQRPKERKILKPENRLASTCGNICEC